MSNNESFIDEVSDAVRRDKLFASFRRYGWIAGLLIVGIVGGTAWQSYSTAKNNAAAQAKGDALLTAMENNEPAARAEALSALSTSPVTALLLAAEQEQSGDADAAAATLDGLANDPSAENIYRQIAAFKAVLVRSGKITPQEKLAALEPMTVPGHPLRLLASEQVALAQLESGDSASALATLQAIDIDAEVTQGLQDRVRGLIVSLGATPVGISADGSADATATE